MFPLKSLSLRIMDDLLHDFAGVFRRVQPEENLSDHRLLVAIEHLGERIGDHPIVIHLRPQGMLERKAHRLALPLVERFEQSRHERL